MADYPLQPHFRYPLELRDGALRVVEQASPADILGRVDVLVRCPLGFLNDIPDFGIEDPTFGEGPINVSEIEDAIALWEPRAESAIEEQFSLLDLAVRRLRIITTGELAADV